jgi:pimeloyl-ACP methyl ester carboxylesterase
MVTVWGGSYGTVVGQYLIKILPPNRIGRIVIDAVVDPTVWADTSKVAQNGASGMRCFQYEAPDSAQPQWVWTTSTTS